MENTNYSITGTEAQKLSRLNKIGITVFILGIGALLKLASQSTWKGKSAHKIDNGEVTILIGFTLMMIGIFLFTRKKSSHQRKVYLHSINTIQKIGLSTGAIGFLMILLAWVSGIFSNTEQVNFWFKISHTIIENATIYLILSAGAMGSGILIYTYGSYKGKTAGIKNNHVWFNSISNGGILGWVLGIVLTIFYIQLYWFSESLEGIVRLFDPLSHLFTGKDASQWFVYGTIYTFLIVFLGIKFIVKYRNNRYQLIRTISVMFFQLVFAYALPYIMEAFVETQGYFGKDLKNIWPLNYYFVDQLDAMSNSGVSGTFYFFWGIVLFLVVTPIFTYYFGKRWYCSWVCGCGGLAETAGDSFRQLSFKKEIAWKIERWIVHSVMIAVLIMTIASLWPYFSGKEYTIGLFTITGTSYYIFTTILLSAFGAFFFFLGRKFKNKSLYVGALITLLILILLTIGFVTGKNNIFYLESKSIKKTYGFLVGASFAGVIGVGFYPLLGNRVWCRFGCPMAGYMGLFQRFKSRFRITTNGSQCISCGNCSTYCEQGIDVRAYAQKGENIVRASCVGCGICSSVCPRGVLKLENGPEEGRFEPNPLIISKEGVKLNG